VLAMKMKKSQKLAGLLRDERGLTTVEYIIILCLIAVVGFAIWKKFGDTVKQKVGGAEGVIGTLPTESAP
jgi:Flp pilus assembly pilin Flp